MNSEIIGWAFTIPGKATVLLGLGLAAVWMLRRAAASRRHLLLTTTFASLAALPLGIAAIPQVGVVVPAVQVRQAPAAAAAAVDIVQPATAAAPAWRMPALSDIARDVWVSGALLMLLLLARDIARLRRLRRDGLPAADLQAFVQSLADRKVEVLVHEDIASPLTFGALRPLILLPPAAREWGEAALRRAIVHELEHVRRGDWAVLLAVRAICAAYWFHPLVWVAWRRLGLEAERACDDAVLRVDERSSYAEQLVTLAQQMSGRAQPALGMARRSDLSVRVAALLDTRQRRGPAGLTTAGIAVAAALLAVAAIAPVEAIAQSPTRTARASRAIDRALFEAAEEGDIASMEELLQAGAKVNVPIAGDGSALIAAARKGHLPAVQLLINRGADINMGVHGDGSALIVAAEQGHIPVVTLLLDRGADINLGVPGDGNPLIMAAGAGQLAVVSLLLDRGAVIEHVVPGDENALIHASESGHLNVVQLLVARGANVNARVWAEGSGDRPGEWRTPLSMARRNGNTAVVDFLLSKGARD